MTGCIGALNTNHGIMAVNSVNKISDQDDWICSKHLVPFESVSHTFNSVDEETAMKVNLVLIEKLDDAYIYSIYTMRSEILIIRFFHLKKNVGKPLWSSACARALRDTWHVIPAGVAVSCAEGSSIVDSDRVLLQIGPRAGDTWEMLGCPEVTSTGCL